MGMRDHASRYQMRTENLLPKFVSDKNPFAAQAETGKRDAANPPTSAPEPSAPASAKSETGSLFDPPPSAAEPRADARVEAKQQPALASATPARPAAAPAKKRAPIGGWLNKLNPLKHLPARTATAKRAKSQAVRPPVQTEMSLERVKVVRNDLSDADLEIIPARPAQPERLVKPEQPALRGGQAGAEPTTAWGRLTSRIFGPGQTQIH
jgi:hypothetical protein